MSDRCSGHCLCGNVHFIAEGQPKWVAYCHCDSCRRATGAAAVVYAGYDQDNVTFVDQQPASFHSSPGVTRYFCARCGSSIAYSSDRWPTEIHLLAGVFDLPNQLKPQAHVYTSEQLIWLHINDSLPRYLTVLSAESQA